IGITIGMVLGSHMPWVDPERLGPNDLVAHAQAYFYLSMPNIVFSAAVVFAVAVLMRSTAAAFITAVVIMVGNGVAGTLIGEMENRTLAALLDPFAGTTFEDVTRYWTVEEKNGKHLPMHGVLLWNRIIWLAVSALVFLFVYFRFSFTDRAVRNAAMPESNADARTTARITVPVVQRRFDRGAHFRQWRRVVWNDLTGMLQGTAFLIVTGIGLVNLVLNLSFST